IRRWSSKGCATKTRLHCVTGLWDARRSVPDAPYEPTQRLHPMSWIFGVLAFVRQLIVPLIVAAIFGSRGGAPTWIGFAIVPLVAAAVWKQIFYRYGLGPAGLVIRDGVFF